MIREAYQWGSGYFLRRLFVIMLLSGAMNRPRHVWHKTIQWLSDGILREQRILANNQGILDDVFYYLILAYTFPYSYYYLISFVNVFQFNVPQICFSVTNKSKI
jgi:hypothetical protein